MNIDSTRNINNTVINEHTIGKFDEATLVNKGIADYEAGKVVDGKKSLDKLREKHGI